MYPATPLATPLTGCTTDRNTQHLHDDTHTLPIKEHLQLYASQIRQKSQDPTHLLHYITTQQTTPRRKKQTTHNTTDYSADIDTDPNSIDDAKNKTNMKHIHICTTLVSTCFNNRQHNKSQTPYHSQYITPKQHPPPEQPVVPWPNSEQTNIPYYTYT